MKWFEFSKRFQLERYNTGNTCFNVLKYHEIKISGEEHIFFTGDIGISSIQPLNTVR
jgi:hypothetical protein